VVGRPLPLFRFFRLAVHGEMDDVVELCFLKVGLGLIEQVFTLCEVMLPMLYFISPLRDLGLCLLNLVNGLLLRVAAATALFGLSRGSRRSLYRIGIHFDLRARMY